MIRFWRAMFIQKVVNEAARCVFNYLKCVVQYDGLLDLSVLEIIMFEYETYSYIFRLFIFFNKFHFWDLHFQIYLPVTGINSYINTCNIMCVGISCIWYWLRLKTPLKILEISKYKRESKGRLAIKMYRFILLKV